MDFLIRTKENRISGPFPKEEILARISRGELREQDEVCPANGYWIFLHERAESRAMLGVELPRTVDSESEENTETETETATATATATDLKKVASVTVTGPRETREGYALPVSAADKTAEIPANGSPLPRGQPETVGAIRFVLWAFVMVIVFILYRVFQLAQDA